MITGIIIVVVAYALLLYLLNLLYLLLLLLLLLLFAKNIPRLFLAATSGGKAGFGGKFDGKICASNGDPELSVINGGDGVFLFFIIVSSPFAGAFGAF